VHHPAIVILAEEHVMPSNRFPFAPLSRMREPTRSSALYRRLKKRNASTRFRSQATWPEQMRVGSGLRRSGGVLLFRRPFPIVIPAKAGIQVTERHFLPTVPNKPEVAKSHPAVSSPVRGTEYLVRFGAKADRQASPASGP
jgi:hypothetical protein